MGNILREPLPGEYEASTMSRFAEFVGMPGASYAELRQWSIADIEAFWGHFERFLGVRWHDRPECVLKSREMPGAEWFPGGTLSFVEHVFAGRDPQKTALISGDGSRDLEYWSWGDLRRRTAAIRAGLQSYGVQKGDRVAAYMPNIPDTMAAFFAVASLGAVWTAIAPEFGFETAVSRLSQVEPKVLLGVDGYRHKGKPIEREGVGREIAEAIGARYVRFGYLDGSGWPEDFASPSATEDELDFEIVAFDHPLWIVYSSGTTGKPKAIVHGHGGALLELGKIGVLQMGLGDSDRHFWYTSSGWIMWNNQLAATLAGSALVLFDEFPDPDAVWRVVSDSKTTVFGAGAAWYEGARRQGWTPAPDMDFSALKAVGSTGSPLPGACYDWIYEILPRSVWLVSVCGGTDVIISLMGLAPGTPVFRGELGGPTLGVDLQSWDENGVAHVGRAGELVLTQPIPSMPLFFWNDESGEKLRDAYYAKFPGIYGHGDRVTVTDRDTVIVEGRSDATLNRRGVRIGSGEIYSALGEVEGIVDSVVVDVPVEGRDSRLVLLVVLAPGRELDDEFAARIRSVLREKCSPYHIPDDVFAVSELPRTLSNKKLEVPIKRILAGAEENDVVSRNSLANPGSLDEIVELAHRLRSAA